MGKYNETTKIEALLADAQACAVIERYLPSFQSNPLLKYAQQYSLKAAMQYASFLGVKKEDAQHLLEEIYAL